MNKVKFLFQNLMNFFTENNYENYLKLTRLVLKRSLEISSLCFYGRQLNFEEFVTPEK
jgi:hypothetical protein